MSSHSADKRLTELGLVLPRVPMPIANFLPYRREGSLVFLAGQVCELDGDVVYRGKVGREFDLETGQAAAKICALNLLASLQAACDGALERVRCCLRVGGFVNCEPKFDKVPLVIDGASDVFCDIFGTWGRHARTAVGVAALPRGAAVEVDAIFALDT